MTIAAVVEDASFTRTYKFEYFADGKVKTGEAISYNKGESKGAMSYSVYKKAEETKFSRKFYYFFTIIFFKFHSFLHFTPS